MIRMSASVRQSKYVDHFRYFVALAFPRQLTGFALVGSVPIREALAGGILIALYDIKSRLPTDRREPKNRRYTGRNDSETQALAQFGLLVC